MTISVTFKNLDSSPVHGIARYMERLSGDRFFGVLQIQYVDGEIVLVRKEESFKPAAFMVVE